MARRARIWSTARRMPRSAVEARNRGARGGAARGPTIIAGSTGTNRATARLIGAIARAPQGAVVLPDLDTGLDEDAWEMIGAPMKAQASVAGHPQAALRRLLRTIEVSRNDVKQLGAPAQRLRARARFLSEALRPAESTHFWRRKRDDLGEAAISDALANVALIVAENETEEALALALAHAGSFGNAGQDRRADHPDPAIARRVAAELERWGIEVENSAGRALGDRRGRLRAACPRRGARFCAAVDRCADRPSALQTWPRAEDLRRTTRARWNSAYCAPSCRRPGLARYRRAPLPPRARRPRTVTRIPR